MKWIGNCYHSKPLVVEFKEESPIETALRFENRKLLGRNKQLLAEVRRLRRLLAAPSGSAPKPAEME